MVMNRHLYQSLVALLFLLAYEVTAPAQGGQYNFRGIPATIEEVDLGLPAKGKFTGQIDLQIVTQGAYFGENANPFAYWQRAHLRPWLQYHPNPRTIIAVSLAYMKKYAVPPTGAKRQDEIRFAIMANFTQPKKWGSFYEQVRGEIKNNKVDGSDEWTHTPRLRVRLGQNFNVKEGQKITTYAEIMVKHKPHTNGFDIFRVFGGYNFSVNPRITMTVGMICQWQLRSNGVDVDVYFGPSVTMRYQFGKSRHPHPPPDPDVD